MKGYIYKITNPNGKIYIGQTINIKDRIKTHKNPKKKSNSKLANSIRKYGWETHILEIIEEVSLNYNRFFLNLQEIYWIDYYDSFNNGLNLDMGGQYSFGKSLSIETRKKISERSKILMAGRKLSEETKKRIGNVQRGRKQSKESIEKRSKTMTGRTLSLEACEKIRNSRKNKIASNETIIKMKESQRKRRERENLKK